MRQRADPDARREQIADAVIDEIAEHGLRAVTLARVAARTGLSIGSIRHYFADTLDEVMRFSFGVLMQRAARRGRSASADPVTRMIDVITLVAPTDDQERKENIALVEYRMAARTDPRLAGEAAEASRAGAEAIRELLRDALGDRVIDETSLRREALVLYALVEGFSLGAALLPDPLQEVDIRAGVTAAVSRLRDDYPPSGA